MNALRLLGPSTCLSVFAFILLGLDAVAKGVNDRTRQIGSSLTLLGLAIAAILLKATPVVPVMYARNMLVWDGLAYFFSWITLLTVLVVVLLSQSYKPFSHIRMNAYWALMLLSAIGLIMLVSANDFLMIFLSIELFGIPSFIIVGYLRSNQRYHETALKFLLIGAISSAMLAYGISLVYGITGTTSLSQLKDALPALQAAGPLALLALIFILVSFGFKIGLVPFHMWVPDVFEGAPAPIAAFISVAPKVAGAAMALRVLGIAVPSGDLGFLSVLAVIAILTMTVANAIALQQTNAIRLLAYSSIAHMGYILLGIIGGGDMGVTGVYTYGWAYLFMNLGAFAIVIAMSNAVGSTQIAAFSGLGRRAPALAALLTLFLLSLAGLPPTVGFIAKYYVLSAAYQSGWIWLTLIGAANSVIAVAYYFRILHAMYFQEATSTQPIDLRMTDRLTLAATSFVTLFLGLFPGPFLTALQTLSIWPKS